MTGKKLHGRIKPRRVVPFLPSVITTAALCFGLLSIGISVQIASLGGVEPSGELIWRGAAFIAIAMVLDILDGRVARAFGIDNRFGVVYDSLSDVVCFGVAPALLVFSRFGSGLENPVLNIGLMIYAICAALRLARFNVQSSSEERKNFMGLPSPMAAGVIISPILVVGELNMAPSAQGMGILYAVAAPVAGFLMVSGIEYRKIRLFSLGRFGRGKKFDFLVTSSIVIAVVSINPGISVAVVSFSYLASGLFFSLVNLLETRRKGKGKHARDFFSERESNKR